MAQDEKAQTCFVIAPIGEEGSDIRTRSDQVLKHIIAPAAQQCGYTPIRADEIAEPGIITSQVIQHVVEDALVVADLTGRNPNVYYELAVRHAVKKPAVQIIQAGESVPFDVAGTRTISVDHRDLDSAAQCREELVRQIRSVEKDPTQVDNPISVAVDLQSLRQSDNPLAKGYTETISMLQELRAAVAELGERMARGGRGRPDPVPIAEMLDFAARLEIILSLAPEEEPTREHFEEARSSVYGLVRVLEDYTSAWDLPSALLLEVATLRRRLVPRK